MAAEAVVAGIVEAREGSKNLKQIKLWNGAWKLHVGAWLVVVVVAEEVVAMLVVQDEWMILFSFDLY